MRQMLLVLLILVIGCAAICVAGAHSRAGAKLLMRAAKSGSVGLARTLIAFGADVNAPDETGGTALFYAAANGRTELLQLLLKRGANAVAVNHDGNTALCYALDTPVPNTEVLRLLIERGALPKQSQHGNPLMCIEHSATSDIYINFLIEHGADVNASDSSGYTPLMKFAYEDNLSAVQKLVQQGAQINAVAGNGQTALSEAVSQGNAEIVEFLLRTGADSTKPVQGHTLVEVAARQRDAYQQKNPRVMDKFNRIIELLNASRG